MSQDMLAGETALLRATGRRRSLREAMSRLEAVVAGPAAGEGWLDQVAAGLAGLRYAIEAHIDEVESADGLLAEIREVAPRLDSGVKELEGEHHQLMDAWARTDDALRLAWSGGAPERVALRRRIVALLGRLTMHRQKGADLVYEAYNVDIAEGD